MCALVGFMSAGALIGWRHQIPIELKLHEVVNNLIQELGTELGSLGRAAIVLDG